MITIGFAPAATFAVIVIYLLIRISVLQQRLLKSLAGTYHFGGVDSIIISTSGGGGGGTGKPKFYGEVEVVDAYDHRANCEWCSKGGSIQDKCKNNES